MKNQDSRVAATRKKENAVPRITKKLQITDSHNPRRDYDVINGFAHDVREGPGLPEGLANHEM